MAPTELPCHGEAEAEAGDCSLNASRNIEGSKKMRNFVIPASFSFSPVWFRKFLVRKRKCSS